MQLFRHVCVLVPEVILVVAPAVIEPADCKGFSIVETRPTSKGIVAAAFTTLVATEIIGLGWPESIEDTPEDTPFPAFCSRGKHQPT